MVVDLRENEERKKKKHNRHAVEVLEGICEFVAEEKKKGNCAIDAGDAVVAVGDAGTDREDEVVDSDSARMSEKRKSEKRIAKEREESRKTHDSMSVTESRRRWIVCWRSVLTVVPILIHLRAIHHFVVIVRTLQD